MSSIFPIQRDELRDQGELLRKALTPSPFVAGHSVSRTRMDGIFRVGTVRESVTTSELVKMKWMNAKEKRKSGGGF